MDIDLTSQALTYTAINRVGIIGSATSNGWNSDQTMTYNATEKCWEIKGITLTAGEMKFRANNDWVLDWGGSLTDITFKGGNIMLQLVSIISNSISCVIQSRIAQWR